MVDSHGDDGAAATSSTRRLTLLVALALCLSIQCVYFNSFLAVVSTRHMTAAHAHLRNQTGRNQSSGHPHHVSTLSSVLSRATTHATQPREQLVGNTDVGPQSEDRSGHTTASSSDLSVEPQTSAPSEPPATPPSLDDLSATSFQLLFDRPNAVISTKFPTATRGIVVSLHHAMVPIGASLIQELRALGNVDPIQIMHCFDAELPEADRALLLAIPDANVEIIDACAAVVSAKLLTADAAKDFQNFWLKPVAVLLSSFDQVMLMDVDNIFLADPAKLWTSALYEGTGTLFFYDRVLNFNFWLNEVQADGRAYLRTLLEAFPYASFGLHPPSTPSQRLQDSMIFARHTAHEQDSSVVMLHKSRLGVAPLKVLWHLATYERHHGHPFSWGDKESFWLACELAQVPYAFSPWAASVVSKPGDVAAHQDTLCGSLAQYDPTTDGPESLVFVNGGDVIDVVDTAGRDAPTKTADWEARGAKLLAEIPQHVTPRHTRHPTPPFGLRGSYDQTCLIGDGSTPLDRSFQDVASRRIRWAVDIATKMTWE